MSWGSRRRSSRSSPNTPRAKSRASCSRSASSRPFCPTRSGSVSTCAARGPSSPGPQLEIIEIPGRARCRACGGEVVLERPFGRCECGGTDLEWLSGEELRVKEYEVSDV